MFCKKSFSEKFHKIHRKTPVPESLFEQSWENETLTQVFSCEFCNILRTLFFTEHLWAAAAQIDPDKIVNYFSLKSCLRTVYQHYTGKFLVFASGISRQCCIWLFSCEKITISRSSRSQMLFKIGVLKNFALFTGKHLCWSLSLIKLLGWRPATLIKRKSNTGVFLWIMRNS